MESQRFPVKCRFPPPRPVKSVEPLEKVPVAAIIVVTKNEFPQLSQVSSTIERLKPSVPSERIQPSIKAASCIDANSNVLSAMDDPVI